MGGNLEISDSDLVALFKAGDATAFDCIYERYWQLLYVSACKILKDEDEAKDIVQEVFISFLNKGAAIEITVNVSVYLYTSVRYKVFDFLSRKKVRENHLDSLQSYLDNGSCQTDSALIEKEIAAEIEKEIQNLPQKMKEVFEMSRKENFSHKKIADTLNISDKTVKKQISNAIKVLKPKFTGYYSLLLMVFIKLF